MVGTPRVLQVLQQEFRSARRTTGLVYDRLPNDKEFALLLHAIRKYSRDFDGTLSDTDCMKLIGIARNTYYKYKRELKDTTPMQ